MDISHATSTDQDTASMESEIEEPLSPDLHSHSTTTRVTVREQRARNGVTGRRGGRGVVGRNQVDGSVGRSRVGERGRGGRGRGRGRGRGNVAETPVGRGSGCVRRGRGSAGSQRGGRGHRAGHHQHNTSTTGKRKYMSK